jgi:hypothetical protein
MTIGRKVMLEEDKRLLVFPNEENLRRLTEEFGKIREEYPVRGNYNGPGGSNQTLQGHWGLGRPKHNICRENICHRGTRNLIKRYLVSQTFESKLFNSDQDFNRSIAKELKFNTF